MTSSLSILWAKKMPKCEEFLQDFNNTYKDLCKRCIIVNPEQKKKYKISGLIVGKRRHAIIIIQGPDHAFILELYYKKFENCYFLCPSVRNISEKELINIWDISNRPSYDTIEISADELVQLAIKTVSEMGNYNLLHNNCQNFVKNYLHALGVKNHLDKLDGERIIDCFNNIFFPIRFF